MYALEGANVGFQLGGQATDMVLQVMNEKGASSILDSKVKLGADAPEATGPKSRDASADIGLRARGDPALLAFPRIVRGYITRRFHTSLRQRRPRGCVRPQDHSKGNRAGK